MCDISIVFKGASSNIFWNASNSLLLHLWFKIHGDLQFQQKSIVRCSVFPVQTVHLVGSVFCWRWQKLPQEGQSDVSLSSWYIKLNDTLNSKKILSSFVLSAFFIISCMPYSASHFFVRQWTLGLTSLISVCFI